MKYLYISKKVETRINSLKKNGKAGSTLADKAESIIERLASGVIRPDMDTAGSFTKYGEKRIRNCRKYDLGCGFRLITLQRRPTIYVTFLGTHDGCQRWLEKNRRLKDIHPGTGKTICIEEKKSKSMEPEKDPHMEASQDYDDIITHFSDRDLRRVFSGLARPFEILGAEASEKKEK